MLMLKHKKAQKSKQKQGPRSYRSLKLEIIYFMFKGEPKSYSAHLAGFYLFYTTLPLQTPQPPGGWSRPNLGAGVGRRAARTGRQTPPLPSAPNCSGCGATGFRVEPLSPSPGASRGGKGFSTQPHFKRFGAAPRWFPGGKGMAGAGSPAAAVRIPRRAHLCLHGLHLYPFP